MKDGLKHIAVVGGGAAGLAAAIAAGDRAVERGVPLDVAVYEADERVGRSILVTGNGRCNYSNSALDARRFYNSEFASRALDALAGGSVIDPVQRFFEGLGLASREEADGRLYPLANKASVVVDVLRAAAGRRGVREVCNAPVSAIDFPREANRPFTLRLADGRFERADAVIVACGGRAVEALDVPSLARLRTRPVLGALKVAPDSASFTRSLDNIRVRCAVTLARQEGVVFTRIMTESGELMFRKYGVSGICVFNLSRLAWPGDVLRIDFLQAGRLEEAEDMLARRRKLLVARFGEGLTYEQELRGLLLPRVAEAVLKGSGIDPSVEFRAFDAAHLARVLSAYPLEVAGIADADQCQVRRGGFSVEAFDPATMAASAVPGFYAAGEALDVDGPCGGYNLHWAWASGILAGRAAAGKLS